MTKPSLRTFLLGFAALWGACSGHAAQPAVPTTAPAEFNPDRYLAHIRFLASDERAGRFPGTEGSRMAAEYLVERFRAAGCMPGGPDGAWLQPFEIQYGKKLIDEKARLEVQGLERKWQLRRDWIPFPFTEMKTVEGPLAFAGYGIQAEEFDYDDYRDFDAEGKILLILRYEPKAEDPDAAFGGETPSRYALFFRKARTAARHGALGLLVVNPPNRDPDRDELYEFNENYAQQTYDLPMAHVTRALADELLRAAGQPDLKTLQQQLDHDRRPLSRDLGLTVRLEPGVEPQHIQGANVLALLPGSAGDNDTIVIGAHRDHLGTVNGRGKDSSPTVFNGADDNASGTAALLELARVLAAGPPLKRNLLFIAFDGEELGLRGSRYFVNHPTIPLEHIKAMINFDMIGRLNLDKYTVFGTGTAAEFPDLVKQAAERHHLECRLPPGRAGGSDHAAFARHDIPTLFVFTGVHKQYHRPEDDWELIDAPGAVRILRMWKDIIRELAEMTDGPTYTEPAETASAPVRPGVEEQQIQQPPENDARTDESDAPPTRGGLTVRLGVVPDMGAMDQPGLLIDSVIEGGPAHAAGLKDGDRIIRIGGEPVRDIYAYMRVLRAYRPGQEADVVVVRDGKEQTFRVTFQPARRRRGGGE